MTTQRSDMGELTLTDRINDLVAKHGSLRAVARVTKIDAGYLSRLRADEKDAPSRTTLRKLGLRAITVYRLAKENHGG